jgi:hypothetical protein
MNARTFFDFLRSPPGLLLLFMGGVAGTLFLFRSCGLASNQGVERFQRGNSAQTVQRFQTGVQEAKFPASATPTAPSGQAAKKKAQEMLTLYATKTRQKRLSALFAPYGRLVKCQLVITVDSASIETPIIGLVTEDVNHDGRLIIPAGTEVHGRAIKSHMRDRIGTESVWTLVFREKSAGFENGQELNVEGYGLDMEEVNAAQQWSITDGSAGLRGQILQTDNLQEIKLFAATAISGLARGLQSSTFNAVTGTVFTPGTAKNALTESAATVADRYAQQILDTIERDGYFVRVPAGKQFYLYVTQTLDQGDARIGSLLKSVKQREAEPKTLREPAPEPELLQPATVQREMNIETNP